MALRAVLERHYIRWRRVCNIMGIRYRQLEQWWWHPRQRLARQNQIAELRKFLDETVPFMYSDGCSAEFLRACLESQKNELD